VFICVFKEQRVLIAEAYCSYFIFVPIDLLIFVPGYLQLIPSSQPLPVTANGYFFYFSLLGNDVTNETFHDLINPNFPAERASVKIRSNVDMLRAFFSCQPGIQVFFFSTADIGVMKG
jgi:centrosomal protein CEP120